MFLQSTRTRLTLARRSPRRAGLTLMELVVALTVAGAAVTAGYAALAGLVDRGEALERVSAELRDGATTRAVLIDWLGGARLDPVRGGASFRGLDGNRDGVADDALTFLTGAATPLGVSRTLVTLRIARDSAGQSLRLVADLQDWDGTERRTVDLASGVAGLDMRFRSGLVTEAAWSPSWISTSVLPAGVELRLEVAAADALPRLLRLPILVPIEASR